MDNLPKSWDDVFADQFIALKNIEDSNKGFYYRKIEIISILTDTSPTDDIWEDIDIDEMNELITSISFIKKEPPVNFSKVIDVFTYRGVNGMTLGEFIHLDYCLVNGMYINLFEICSILYRKTRQDEWGNTQFEPYKIIDFDRRKKHFEDLELKITDIYGVLEDFIQFKLMIVDNYRNIFPKSEKIDGDDDSEFTEEELEAIKKEEELDNEKKQWSWENIIRVLSNDDIDRKSVV